jgi:hypothetical protein
MGRLVLGQEVLLVFRRKKASVPLHHDPVVIWSREHWPVLTKVAASCAVPRGQLMYPRSRNKCIAFRLWGRNANFATTRFCNAVS